ncbi:esterase [Mycobacterium colombiense]|uniref:alpha/beta fold hydrolase n=1 Tax=Mycobacterium colombiense TaxID=339268 RepID=UPI0007EF5FA3|nr:alpha/beta hydrolase [Mycobacterium colombiense]OBK63266.1 esterase [Mycobacterium colombiense]
MPLPDLVLVHGGAHGANCWDLTAAELRRQAPELRVLAVDLPGRSGKPGDLAKATISEWVDSVVADIDHAQLNDIVIVGHSMAGVTVPGVVAKLGASKVREMVFVAAFVPPQGTAIVHTIGGPLGWFARLATKRNKATMLPKALARYAFCNGMTSAQREFTLSRLYAEAISIVGERVNRNLPDGVPRTWIMTTYDRALSIQSQRNSIAALGGVQTQLNIAACHDVMISHPATLAQVLIDRCEAHR